MNIAIGSRIQLHMTKNGIDQMRTGMLARADDKVVVLLKDDGTYGTYRRWDINVYVRL